MRKSPSTYIHTYIHTSSTIQVYIHTYIHTYIQQYLRTYIVTAICVVNACMYVCDRFIHGVGTYYFGDGGRLAHRNYYTYIHTYIQYIHTYYSNRSFTTTTHLNKIIVTRFILFGFISIHTDTVVTGGKDPDMAEENIPSQTAALTPATG